MKRMKSGKVFGAVDIPVEGSRFVGERSVDFLTRLFKTILES